MVKTNILDPEDDHLIQNVRVAYYIYTKFYIIFIKILIILEKMNHILKYFCEASA